MCTGGLSEVLADSLALQLQSCLTTNGCTHKRFTDLSTLRGQSLCTFPLFDLKTTESAKVMRVTDAVRASVRLRKQEGRAAFNDLLGSELDGVLDSMQITEFVTVFVAIASAAALESRIPTGNKTKNKIGM